MDLSTIYKQCGHGGYIHNSNGDMIVAYTDNITAEYPLEVELQGPTQRVNICLDRGIRKILQEDDNLILVSTLQKLGHFSWDLMLYWEKNCYQACLTPINRKYDAVGDWPIKWQITHLISYTQCFLHSMLIYLLLSWPYICSHGWSQEGKVLAFACSKRSHQLQLWKSLILTPQI